jgi:hypothetical protein
MIRGPLPLRGLIYACPQISINKVYCSQENYLITRDFLFFILFSLSGRIRVSLCRTYFISTITGFVDFVHRPEFEITWKHSASETGPVSIFWWGEGDTYSVGCLRPVVCTIVKTLWILLILFRFSPYKLIKVTFFLHYACSYRVYGILSQVLAPKFVEKMLCDYRFPSTVNISCLCCK